MIGIGDGRKGGFIEGRGKAPSPRWSLPGRGDETAQRRSWMQIGSAQQEMRESQGEI